MISGFLSPFVSPRTFSLSPIYRSVDLSDNNLRITVADEFSRTFPLGDASPGTVPYSNCVARLGENSYIGSAGVDLHVVQSGLHETVTASPDGPRIVELFSNRCQEQFGLVRLHSGSIMTLTRSTQGSYQLNQGPKFSSFCSIALSSDPGSYCVSEGEKLFVFSGEREISFPLSAGPVEYLPRDPNVLVHGTSTSLGFFDIRTGRQVLSWVSAHPGCVTLTSYTQNLNYSLIGVNPVHVSQIAAFSSVHSVFQLIDSRKIANPIAELALPEREHILTRPMRRSPWKRLEFRDDGRQILLVRPGYIEAGCVIGVDPEGQYSPLSILPLVPTREAQVCKFNKDKSKSVREGFEVCMGAMFSYSNRSEIVSVTSKGRFLHISDASDSFSSFSSINATKRQAHKVWFNDLSFEGSTKFIAFNRVEEAITLLKEVKPHYRLLYAYEQAWMQWFVGLCRGLKKCKKHAGVGSSVPGSSVWLRCVQSGCVPRIKAGPPRGVYDGQVNFSSIYSIHLAYGRSFGAVMNRHRIRDYLKYLEESANGWCEAKFLQYDDCFMVKYNIVSSVSCLREEKISLEPPKSISEDDSEDQLEVSISQDVFSQRKETERSLVAKSVVAKSDLKVVKDSLIEKLKIMYSHDASKDPSLSFTPTKRALADDESFDSMMALAPAHGSSPLPPKSKQRAGF